MISDNFKVFRGRKFISADYAIYKSSLYRATHINNNSLELVSENIASTDQGFSPYKFEETDPSGTPDIFTKEVTIKELDELFSIKYSAEYEGLSFQIVTTNTLKKSITISTNDAEIARKFDFIRADKYYFEKELPLIAVQVVEEKIDLLNNEGVIDFNYVN